MCVFTFFSDRCCSPMSLWSTLLMCLCICTMVRVRVPHLIQCSIIKKSHRAQKTQRVHYGS
uniref:Uncharacterized protein n=1 Tax=Anguilla anguilla TaxID=7936 RepID=A0A0E9QWB0_ANGAN